MLLVGQKKIYLANKQLRMPHFEKVKEKQKMFEVRNDMTKIPANYGKEILCLCGTKETINYY